MKFKEWLARRNEGLFVADTKAEESKSRRKKTPAEMRGTKLNVSGIAGGPGGAGAIK